MKKLPRDQGAVGTKRTEADGHRTCNRRARPVEPYRQRKVLPQAHNAENAEASRPLPAVEQREFDDDEQKKKNMKQGK